MLKGSLFALVLYDVSEAINLAALGTSFRLRTVAPSFKHATPQYLGFDTPPVVQTLDPLSLESGEDAHVQMKYYEYGVVSCMFELSFTGDWESLIKLSSDWMGASEFEQKASAIIREKLSQAGTAVINPHSLWLNEDYLTFHFKEIPGSLSAADLIANHGSDIARLVRGETAELSIGEQAEVLKSSISYYATDLAVIGWNAAFIYDTDLGASTAIQLLEYANSQLLEFRYYDELLTRELKAVYSSLERGTGFLGRWRLGGAASRLQTVLLDITELTERLENALKFLSDMFSARLYRLAADKVGVPDYKNLVNQKLRTAEELYGFLVDQFHQNRAFILELTVVVILVVELGHLFYAKK